MNQVRGKRTLTQKNQLNKEENTLFLNFLFPFFKLISNYMKKQTTTKKMVMEKEEQIKKLQEIAVRYGVPIDIYDFEAMLDSSLTFEENKSIIEEDLKILASSENVENKIKAEGTRKTIKNEKEDIERIKMQQLNEEMKHTEKEFKESLETLEANNSVLKKLYWLPKQYVEVVVNPNNQIYGLVFTGQAGTSKSFSTIQTLNELGADYEYFAGYTTPLGLYEFLYNNKEEGRTIVFDDTFGILNNTTSVTLMLNALHSSSGKRKISWSSSKLKDLPSEFIFNANVILITNEVPSNLGSSLISSRCLNYRFEFNNYELLSIMKAIASLKHPTLSKNQRHEVVKFMEEYVDETTKSFDLRTQNKIENLYMFSQKSWKDLAMPLISSKNEKLVLLKQFILSSQNLQEAKAQWSEATGLGERQFQRYSKKLKMETTIRPQN